MFVKKKYLFYSISSKNRHSAVLQFYFETFDYPVYTLYRETVIEFLCE